MMVSGDNLVAERLQFIGKDIIVIQLDPTLKGKVGNKIILRTDP